MNVGSLGQWLTMSAQHKLKRSHLWFVEPDFNDSKKRSKGDTDERYLCCWGDFD